MSQKITTAAVLTLFLGNVPVEVPAGTQLTFPNAPTVDELAESLAQNQVAYATHREQLAHEETGERNFEGQLQNVRIRVTYGVGGARNEEILGLAEEAPAVEAPAPEAEQPAQDGGEGEGQQSEQVSAFKVGDVVREKGSAVLMTVVAVEESGVKCNWFEGNDLREATFAADALFAVESGS